MFNLNPSKHLKLSALLATSLLVACDSSSDNDKPSPIPLEAPAAVIQTVDSGYSTSKVAYIDLESFEVTEDFYVKESQSDFTVSSYKNNVYHIGRNNIDTIDKYSSQSINLADWSYSTNDSGTGSNNTYTMVSYSETKAFLINYGSDAVWVVNPQATTSEDFKTGELDLSSYSPTNNTNTPTASDGIIVDDKLFVVMQRLGQDWSAGTAYLAVFDITTGEEIETNADDKDAVKGIPLTGFNPWSNSLASFNNKVYVTQKTLIEAVDVSTYQKDLVLDGSGIIGDTYGRLIMSEVVSEQQAYVVFNVWENGKANDNVFAFNPTTGQNEQDSITGYVSTGVPYITLDANNSLWVGAADDANPGIDIFDTSDNSLLYNRIALDLNPHKIVFVESE